MAKFRRTVENIWYHYKVQIIVGVFLIATLIFCLHSCLTKETFDLQVYYVTGSSAMYNEQLQWLEQALSTHCSDYNGDGKITVAVTGLRVGEGSSPNERAEWMTAVNAGEVMLFIGDEGGIRYLYRNNYLQPLTEYSSNLWAADCAWEVTGSAFSEQTPGFAMFEYPVYAALRVFDNTWSSRRGSAQKAYSAASETLRSIIQYSEKEE